MSRRSNNVTILSWNVNGIRAAERKGFLPWIRKTAPDILCVQETKAHAEQLSEDLLKPAPYTVHFESGVRKGYSGVATFSLEAPKKVINGFGEKRFDDEGRVLITEYAQFTLLNIYFPNGKKDNTRLQYKLDFYDFTLNFCNKLRKKGHKLVVCGDYNTAHKPIDLEHPEANKGTSGFLPIEREWLDALISSGFIDTLRVFNSQPRLYTWWDMKSRARDRNVGWRIDYHFVSEELKDNLTGAFILPEVQGSDHCPAGLKLSF